MSTDKSDDRELEEYLAGDSALSRLYRGDAGEQPPEDLDQRILEQAHGAVEHRARVVHGPFARHWMVPISLAAVVVVSVSVVLLMPDPEMDADLGLPSAVQPAAPASEAASDYAAPPPGKELPAIGGVARLSGEQPASPATFEEGREHAGQEFAAAPAAPAPSLASRQSRVADELEEKSLPGRKREAAVREEAVAAMRQAAPAEPAPRALASEPDFAATSVAKRKAPASPDPAPPDRVQADPQNWMRFIEELLRDENLEGAKSNLRAFRNRYPHQRLSPELERLAKVLDGEAETERN